MDTAAIEQTTVAEEAVTQVSAGDFSDCAVRISSLRDATVLATNTTVDLHRALDLVQRGCPPSSTFRHVDQVDDEAAAGESPERPVQRGSALRVVEAEHAPFQPGPLRPSASSGCKRTPARPKEPKTKQGW